MGSARPMGVPAAVTVVMASVLMAGPPAFGFDVDDTVTIVKEDELLSNAEIAARLSEVTFTQADTVLIGRDDDFPDSLASGLLQSTAPLLLMPPEGPLPGPVRDELQRLDPSRIILLGGTAALSADVEAHLRRDYAVERREGASRFETAIDIAETDAGDAQTAILARAFPAEGSTDATQGFADALGAGGLAATNGWPVLLTQTDVLTGSTRDYLRRSGITRVVVVGGVAAVSEGVAHALTQLGIEVERLAGFDRFSTAVEIAEELGAPSAADAQRVTLVEGQGADAWAGGFAAAGHAARFRAPVVLSSHEVLPPASQAWLSAGGGPTFEPEPHADPVLVCVAPVTVCATGRLAMDLPPLASVTFQPPSGTTVPGGQRVEVTITREGEPVEAALVNGSCVGGRSRAVTVVDGQMAVVLEAELPAEECDLTVTFELPNGAVQRVEVSYVGSGVPLEATAAPTSLEVDVDGGDAFGPGDVVNVRFDQPTRARSGDTLMLIDAEGDEVEVACGTTADCSVGGSGTASHGLDVAVEVTGDPRVVVPRGDGVVDLDTTTAVLSSTMGNDFGPWNLAASGLPHGERVLGELDPSNADLPVPLDVADISSDADQDLIVVADADCAPLEEFEGVRVYAVDGAEIARGDVVTTANGCEARMTSARDLADDDVVRVLYRDAGPYVPSQTVEHRVGSAAPPPPPPEPVKVPVSTDLDLTGDTDGALGPGDQITATFDDVIAAPGGSGVRLLDHEGDEGRVLCGTHAECEVAGAVVTLRLTAGPEIVQQRRDSLLQTSTWVAALDSDFGNAVGNWNLPASGLPSGERVLGATDPANAVLTDAIAAEDVTIDAAADTVTIVDADCTPMRDYDTVYLTNVEGVRIGVDDSRADEMTGECTATIAATTDLMADDAVMLYQRGGGAFTISESRQLTVP